jgi:hydrogenase maturation protease
MLTNRPPGNILVAGLGNVLMGDDGAGPWVIRFLESHYRFPPQVTVLDLGTPGLNITSFLQGYESIIFIDTVHGDGPPGSVLTFGRDALLNATPQARIGPHDPGVHEALWSLELAGEGPRDVLLVGVIPADCAMGKSPGAAVHSAIPSIVNVILAHLQSLDITWTEQERGNGSELWWKVNRDQL